MEVSARAIRREEEMKDSKLERKTQIYLFSQMTLTHKNQLLFLYIYNKQSENEFIKWQNGKSMEIYKENNDMLMYVF